MCCPGTAMQDWGQTSWPPLRGLRWPEVIWVWGGRWGCPNDTSLDVNAADSMPYLCWGSEGLRLLSVMHASTCLSQKWAYSQFGRQETGAWRQRSFRESFLQEVLHFSRADNDNMSEDWVSGWFLGALFIAFCSDVWFPWWQKGCWADSSFGATLLALMLTGFDSFDWDEKI